MLKRMIISQGRFFSKIFMNTAMYCGIARRQTFQGCFEFITFHYSNCCILPVKTMLNNSETDRKKICTIQSQVTTLQMAFTYNRKYFLKSYQFLKYALVYLHKGRYAPGRALKICDLLYFTLKQVKQNS